MEVDKNGDHGSSMAALTCMLGDLSQADGSASLTHGNTTVLAAAYGPCEVKISKEILDQATVEVVFKPKSGLPTCADKFREKHIHGLFQATILVSLHPRSSVTIIVQELEDRGALLATSINAACLALLDAGVNMKFLVAAVTALIDKDGTIVLAPEEKQTLSDSCASVMLVFNEKDFSIMGASSSGKISQKQYDRCVVLCREASQSIFTFYRDTLKQKMSKSV